MIITLTNSGTFSIQCPSTTEVDNWVNVIESAIAGRKDLYKETVEIQEELRKLGHSIPADDLQFETEDVIGTGNLFIQCICAE